jgi:glycerophosphoryl diester phosphodiesterase
MADRSRPVGRHRDDLNRTPLRTRRILTFLALGIALVLLCFVLIGGGLGNKEDTPSVRLPHLLHIAHRAGRTAFPENSGDGIRHSIAQGYAAVELDISATQDGVLVLYHDDSCMRLSGLERRLDEVTFAELTERPLRLNGETTRSFPIGLDSALTLCTAPTLIYLDMKLSGFAEADRLARTIAAHGASDRVLVASSSVRFLMYLEFKHPEINTVLEGFDKGEEWTWWLMPRKCKPDMLSSFASEADVAHIAWLREHDLLPLKIVYGVDTASYRGLRELGVSRFIVDEDVGPPR